MGLLTEEIRSKTPNYVAKKQPFSKAQRLLYTQINIHTRRVFFSKEGKSANIGDTNDGIHPFMPTPTYSAPTNPCRCSQFPPAFVGLAARPRAPTSPAMLTPERRALPKLGEAGGSPRSFAPRGKTAGRPRRRRVRCAPRPKVLRCSAGGTGSAGRADAVA